MKLNVVLGKNSKNSCLRVTCKVNHRYQALAPFDEKWLW